MTGGQRHASQGFNTGAWVLAKSLTLRETIIRLWWIAVAANRPSIADRVMPLSLACAASKPQRWAMGSSIGRILPEKRGRRSVSSHVSN